MVHRKVEHQTDSAAAVMNGVMEQLAADRAAVAALYGAIQTVAGVVNIITRKDDESSFNMFKIVRNWVQPRRACSNCRFCARDMRALGVGEDENDHLNKGRGRWRPGP